MFPQPVLTTERLRLRAFVPADADALGTILRDPRLVRLLPDLPTPFTPAAAAAWIDLLPDAWNARVAVVHAVEVEADERLVGAVQLRLEPDRQAEVGFWIGVQDWGKGLASEALQAVLFWSFEGLGLVRVHAKHASCNPASGRAMLRAGMRRETGDSPETGEDVSYQCRVSDFTRQIERGIVQAPRIAPNAGAHLTRLSNPQA